MSRLYLITLRRRYLAVLFALAVATLITLIERMPDREDARWATTGRNASSVPPGSQEGRPIFSVPTAGKRMSFAVNIDWGEEHLPQMLDILRNAQVRVTFFPTGRWAEKFPDIVRRIRQEGHEIGNHGHTHSYPTQLGDAAVADLIVRGEKVIEEITGVKSRLFAPPAGDWNERTVKVASGLGYHTVMWTLDTIDWQRPPAQTIVQRIVPKAQAGAIVLMHPTAPTVEALPVIIQGLRAQGYELVPVGELIKSGQSQAPGVSDQP